MKRLWSGLRARVILTYLIIFLVSAAIVAGRAGVLFGQIALSSAEREMEVRAYLMASALERPWIIREGPDEGALLTVPQIQLQTLTGNFAQGASGQLVILDTRGNPVAYSTNSIPANQSAAPEVAAALSGWVQHDIRVDSQTGQKMIFAAAPIQRAGHVLGVAQVATPLAQVTAGTRSFWLNLGLTAVLAALAAAVAGWVLAGQLVGPVKRLRDAAASLAAGNLDERVPPEHTGGVAEISQLAEAFNHMAERIGDMISRERAFVANASHELRTPLTNIKLRAEALGNGALEDKAVAGRFVGEIESEANRLGRMAGDLLTLSRQDAAVPAFREKVDPAVLIDEVTTDMSLRAEKSGVKLWQQVDPDLPHVTADSVGLHTVLTNLLDNALQYTPAGGTIIVRACYSQQGDVTSGRPEARNASLPAWTAAPPPAAEGGASDTVSNGWERVLSSRPVGRPSVVIAVTDTGTGIPPEDLPHIFERFYRADKARSRRLAQKGGIGGSGAGLGLAIVRGIVEEHGGAVQAESAFGEGTTISIILPLDNGEEPATG